MDSKKIVFSIILLGFLSARTLAQISESKKATIAYKIVETSARCKQLTRGLYDRVIKNGGTSYGVMLESSPNPKTDPSQSYSKTYNFNLHESYADRMPVIARFVFDPVKRQLFEEDTANDILIPIAFDKKLLWQFDQKK